MCVCLAGSLDETIRLWSLSRGTCLSVFMTHVPVLELAIAMDGNIITSRLENINSLPIIGLHNNPALTVMTQRSFGEKYNCMGFLVGFMKASYRQYIYTVAICLDIF